MGKKIVLAIFGGIAVMGLLVMIVGFAMGGRPGSMTVYDGQLVYAAGGERVAFANAPVWLSRSWWRGRGGDGDTATSSRGSTGGVNAPAASLPFTADQLQAVEIDISAGIVVVQTGDAPALTVDGPMEYTSTFEDGVWHIESLYEDALFNTVGRRYWLGDTDLTTTFTITLPQAMAWAELDVELDMGEATVTGFTLEKLACSTDMGSITVRDVTATEGEFDVNMGGITVSGFQADSCDLDCDLGSIEFKGLVRESFTAGCDMGGITASLQKPASYSGTADVSLGGIKVAGSAAGGAMSSSHFSGNFDGTGNDYTLAMDLECGLGGIEVTFY